MFLKSEKIETRSYQEHIFEISKSKNTLVVLPTGLGKTIIALKLIDFYLQKYTNKKTLFLAPTKPLCLQHFESIKNLMSIDKEDLVLITGQTKKTERKESYENKKIIIATPQTIANDLAEGFLGDINIFSLIIFDEAHRAVGNYAYSKIARNFSGRVLGLTASPGSEEKHIEEIARNLKIQTIELRTKESKDVAPYIKDIEFEFVKINLPVEMEKLKLQIENFIEQHSFKLKELGLTKKSKINRYDAIQLQNRLLKILKQKKGYAFQAIVHIAAINKAYHALALLETQGLEALQNYLTRMGEKPKLAKSEKVLLESLEFKGVMNELKKENLEHPKIQKLLEILHENFSKNKKSRVIVFCQYRDTVGFLESILDKNKTIKAKAFIGQATKGKLKGMSQEEQKEIISDFKSGKYNVLLATSVAEEGIDIPEVDLVVFYEPVPSEIRTIQRKGRTARKFKGKVIMLITQKTLDERSYYSAGRKEKKMKESIEKVKKKISMLGLQRKLFEY